MTTLYHKFLGIDIGKFEFVVNIHGSKSTKSYLNDPEGVALFYEEHQEILKETLVVLEVTGGYERYIIRYLQAKSIAVHGQMVGKLKTSSDHMVLLPRAIILMQKPYLYTDMNELISLSYIKKVGMNG